jgi:hypothetical protein
MLQELWLKADSWKRLSAVMRKNEIFTSAARIKVITGTLPGEE